MVVGNRSARRFANAPWCAFTWTRAYVAELNRDPRGTIQDAALTSLELAEPVASGHQEAFGTGRFVEKAWNCWANQGLDPYLLDDRRR